MCRLRQIYRDPQLPRRYRHPLHMILVLMRDQDRVQRLGLLAGRPHPLHQLAAAQSRIHQNPRRRAGDNRAVAPRPAGQHRHPHHSWRIRPAHVEGAYDSSPHDSAQVPRVAAHSLFGPARRSTLCLDQKQSCRRSRIDSPGLVGTRRFRSHIPAGRQSHFHRAGLPRLLVVHARFQKDIFL